MKHNRPLQLNDIFPLYGTSQDLVISKYGDYAIIYELGLPELHALDTTDYIRINAAFTKALSQLPDHILVQRSDFCYPDTSPVYPDDESYLDKRFAAFFADRPFIKSRCYLTFIRKSSLATRQTLFSNLLHLRQGYFKEAHYSAAAVEAFRLHVARFLESIAHQFPEPGKQVTFAPLDGPTAWELCAGQYLSATPAGGSAAHSPDLDNRDPAQLVVGQQLVNIFAQNTDGYPPFLETSVPDVELSGSGQHLLERSFLHQLVYGLPFAHILTNVYFPLNQRQARESLDSRLRLFRATALGSPFNGTKQRQLEDFIQGLNEAEQLRLTGHYFNILVLSPASDPAQQVKNLAMTANRLDDLGIRYNRQNYAVLNSFLWSMPGAARMIPENEIAVHVTEHVLCYQVWEGNSHSAANGVRFCDRRSGIPLQVDLWNYPGLQNHNQVTIGPSGTGKSFLLGHIVRHFIHQHTDVVIVDIGASYKKLSMLEKEVSGLGTIIESNAENPFRFNPFLLLVASGESRVSPEAQEDRQDNLNFIASLIFTAWKAGNERISTEAYTVLMEMTAHYQAYFEECSRLEVEKTGKNSLFLYPDFRGFYNFFLDQYPRFYPDLTERHFDLQSFRLVLRAFAVGTYRDLFNCPTNPDIFHDRFVIFELDHIKDDPVLFPITALLIMQVVIQKMIRQKSNRKLYFLLDEVWKILSSSMQPFVKYMYKTARKHGCGVNIATQEFKDITSSGIGDTLISNSDTKILLRQKKDVYEDLRLGFSLTQHQLDLLYSLRIEATFREVFFLFLDQAKVYRLEVSPSEMAVHTSGAGDKRLIYDDYARHGSMKLAIKNFIEHQFHMQHLLP